MEDLATRIAPPVLIVSTSVGCGMFSIGEAIKERLPADWEVSHAPIEAFLPERAVAEDLKRYRWISSRAPFLLYLIYNVPFVYQRKLLRERRRDARDLERLREEIARRRARTVLCVSHRAAFWVSSLKSRAALDFQLWDMLAEFGNNWGYRYMFWEAIDGFLSPVPRDELRFKVPDRVQWLPIQLPVRRHFAELAATAGARAKTLLIGGVWGQGPLKRALQEALSACPGLQVLVVCGENEGLYRSLIKRTDGRVEVFGRVPSIAPLLEQCASIVTKPGISTILEAHAARRKIFLFRGMPVAEENNARYALRNLGAERFSGTALARWLQQAPA